MKICSHEGVGILSNERKVSKVLLWKDGKSHDVRDINPKEKLGKHENSIWRMVEFFFALSDPTRVKILLLLMDGEKCVGELAEELGASSSRVSHQLRILKQLRLVKGKREGKFIKYSIADEHVIIEALNVAFYHVAEYMEL